MVDLSAKFALVAAFAWLLTCRAMPSQAAAAHRVWLLVLAMPVLWLAARALIPPIVFVEPRPSVWPASIVAPQPGTLSLALNVYAVVATVLMIRVATGVLAVQRLLRRARPLPDSELASLRAIAGDVLLDVREADLPVPVTAGFMRAAVILPAGWRAMSAPALRAILRHELAHVRRRDCSVALACALIEAALWFHPAIWLATSRVRWFAEMACDAAAARAMDAGSYAAELLALAGYWHGARRPSLAITAGANTAVARRIASLLDEMEGRGRWNLVPLAAVVALAAVPCLAVVSIGAAADRPPIDHGGHAIAHQQRHRH